MNERRKKSRIKTDLKVTWEGARAQLKGNIVDLSTTGCFILSDDQVRTGELIRIIIHTEEYGLLYIWGEVVYQIPEMGFAAHFTGADDTDLNHLTQIVRSGLYNLEEHNPVDSSDLKRA
jgi:hypothetical protein